jgi:enoyl-CoA hydratase/carnithine racemase
MIFAARENAVIGQFECGTGALPGAGGLQHLTRRLGRHRAIEVITSADDCDLSI